MSIADFPTLAPVASARDFCARLGLKSFESTVIQVAETALEKLDDPHAAAYMAALVALDIQILRQYARGYYHGPVPESVLCAYLAWRSGLDASDLPQSNRILTRGFESLAQAQALAPTAICNLNDAQNTDHCDAAYLGMAMLNHELTTTLLELRRPSQHPGEIRISPAECPAWVRATSIQWPACEFSVENTLIATRIHRLLTPKTPQRPARKSITLVWSDGEARSTPQKRPCPAQPALKL